MENSISVIDCITLDLLERQMIEEEISASFQTEELVKLNTESWLSTMNSNDDSRKK